MLHRETLYRKLTIRNWNDDFIVSVGPSCSYLCLHGEYVLVLYLLVHVRLPFGTLPYGTLPFGT